MLFIPHKLQRQFLPGLPPSPLFSQLPPSSLSSPSSSSSSPLPPSSFSCNERIPHGRASQFAIQPPCPLHPCPPKISVANKSLQGLNSASLSPSFGTARPAFTQTPIADRFTRPGFNFAITDSTTKSWRQSPSTSLESQVSDMSISNPSTVSPLRFSSTSSLSMDFLYLKHSLDAITREGEEGKGEEGAGQGWASTHPRLTPEQGFHIAEERFFQEIGGAGPDIQPRNIPSPTIIAIQPSFDDAGHYEQKLVQSSKTFRSIKKSLRSCEYNALFHVFFHCDIDTTENLIKAPLTYTHPYTFTVGRLVKETWATFKQKSDRISRGDEPHVPQPLNISATGDQDHHPHHSDNNHIHNIRPERPAQFPFPTRTAGPPYVLRQSINSAEVQINITVDFNESRHRERLHRRALKRLKSIGQFRRRPNLIPEMTEGRTTEPVEVARIRRAYTQRGLGGRRLGQSGRVKESLLERVNRQRRAQVQEWRVTRLLLLPSQAHSSCLKSTPTTEIVTIPLHDEVIESRPSMRQTISTRVSGSRSKRKGGSPSLAPKTRFALHWNKYERKKLDVLRESPQEVGLVHENERRRYPSHHSEQRSPCRCQVPSEPRSPCHCQVSRPLRRCNSLTSTRASASSSPTYHSVHAGSTLSTLAGSIARSRHSHVSPRSNLDSAPNSRRSSRFLMPIAEASNRLSVVSMASCNSAVSGISSMANSIYSVLSEDWNRPFFFAQSRSYRCPTSLQSNVRALPPYDQLTASITSTGIQRANTRHQMTEVAGRVRSRGLRNEDGSIFQLIPGQQLQSTDIRITWREITESFLEDNDDPASAISLPCLSALPTVRDSLGFIEYDDDGDEDEEEGQDQTHQFATPDAPNAPPSWCGMDSGRPGTDDWTLEDPSRPVLDVNDTSAMIAAGIDPSEPHPNPEAFYRLYYPTEHQTSIHGESKEISAGADTDNPSCSYNHDQKSTFSSDGPVDNATFAQSFHSVLTKPRQHIAACLQKTQKWICKPLKKAFSSQSQRSPHCTVTEIWRAGPGLDRSYSDTMTSARAKEWLCKLPGGHASAGRFDRDWLDAQLSSSSFVQPLRA